MNQIIIKYFGQNDFAPKVHQQQKMIGHYMEDKGAEGELAMGGGRGGEMKEEQEHDLSGGGGGGSAPGLPMVPYDDQVPSNDTIRGYLGDGGFLEAREITLPP